MAHHRPAANRYNNIGSFFKRSLKKALAELGFKGGTRSETERNQWVAAEKERLAEIMLQHGIEWEKKGTHRKERIDLI